MKKEIIEMLLKSAKEIWGQDKKMIQVAATQAIHESGWQDDMPSKLASDDKNLFGIKGSGTAGYVERRTREYSQQRGWEVIVQQFAKNATYADSFRQHKSLMLKKRYQPVMAAISPQVAFVQLQKCGYATDLNYSKYLTEVWEKYIKEYFK